MNHIRTRQEFINESNSREIDSLLDKINATGIDSLTPLEKKRLDAATGDKGSNEPATKETFMKFLNAHYKHLVEENFNVEIVQNKFASGTHYSLPNYDYSPVLTHLLNIKDNGKNQYNNLLSIEEREYNLLLTNFPEFTPTEINEMLRLWYGLKFGFKPNRVTTH